MLWGAGTAIGEIPPYMLSYAAKSSGKRNEEYEEMMEDANKENSGVVGSMVKWMIDFMHRYRFALIHFKFILLCERAPQTPCLSAGAVFWVFSSWLRGRMHSSISAGSVAATY